MQRSSLSYISASSSLRLWRVAVLVVGLALLLGSTLRWVKQKEANNALESKLAQAQPKVVMKPVRSEAEQRALDMQIKAVGNAVRQLNMPIADLIKALQAPKDIRVVLLSLDVSGKGSVGETEESSASGSLKIGAEARTPQEMMTYVAFLADQHLFKSVYLVKHEVNGAAPEKPYRFQLEAQWRD